MDAYRILEYSFADLERDLRAAEGQMPGVEGAGDTSEIDFILLGVDLEQAQ